MGKSKKIILDNSPKILNEDFIIFGEDFARHPHALEHLLRPLFPNNRFLWVETIGLRSPKICVYDMKRIFEKFIKWFGKVKVNTAAIPALPENIIILTPFMIPFNQFIIIRKFNQWNVKRNIKNTLKLYKFDNPISIASVPNAGDYIGAFQEKLKIYYCVDEFSLWPGLDKKMVGKLEKTLIAKVDLIIATSEHLSKSKYISNKETSIITHGVDFAHFNIGENKKSSPILKLCYFGLFDERSDQLILKDLAENIPNCEIHIWGSIVCDIKMLKLIKNIIFHGKINYHELPIAIKEMDIFLLPYVRNELTDNINPLKLKEYLSTGRPVIATPLPEVVKLNDYLYLGTNSMEFITIVKDLQSCLHHNKKHFPCNKVIEFIKKNETWEAKAKILSGIIQSNL